MISRDPAILEKALGLAEVEPVGDLELKGFAKPVPTFNLLALKEGATGCGLHKAGLPERKSSTLLRLLLAEAVEEVPRARIFEIIIQNPVRFRINVASSSAYKNDSCTKSVGSDFFNSLSQKQT